MSKVNRAANLLSLEKKEGIRYNYYICIYVHIYRWKRRLGRAKKIKVKQSGWCMNNVEFDRNGRKINQCRRCKEWKANKDRTYKSVNRVTWEPNFFTHVLIVGFGSKSCFSQGYFSVSVQSKTFVVQIIWRLKRQAVYSVQLCIYLNRYLDVMILQFLKSYFICLLPFGILGGLSWVEAF